MNKLKLNLNLMIDSEMDNWIGGFDVEKDTNGTRVKIRDPLYTLCTNVETRNTNGDLEWN